MYSLLLQFMKQVPLQSVLLWIFACVYRDEIGDLLVWCVSRFLSVLFRFFGESWFWSLSNHEERFSWFPKHLTIFVLVYICELMKVRYLFVVLKQTLLAVSLLPVPKWNSGLRSSRTEGSFCSFLALDRQSFLFIILYVAFVGVTTWFRDGSATHPSVARVISTQTPMWWMANGVYW